MNKEETALYQKQYKKDNKERIRSHQKKWERYNKEKIAVKQKQHWQNNKEDIKAKIDAYKATPQWKKHIRSLAYKMDSKYTGMTNRNKARGFGPLPFTKLEWILWWNVYPRLKVIVPIYNAWKATDFKDRKLSLSVDRINTVKGYSLDNIQFMTHSENSIKRNLIDCPGQFLKILGHCIKFEKGVVVLYFPSVRQAAKHFKVSRSRWKKLKMNTKQVIRGETWITTKISRDEYEKSLPK